MLPAVAFHPPWPVSPRLSCSASLAVFSRLALLRRLPCSSSLVCSAALPHASASVGCFCFCGALASAPPFCPAAALRFCAATAHARLLGRFAPVAASRHSDSSSPTTPASIAATATVAVLDVIHVRATIPPTSRPMHQHRTEHDCPTGVSGAKNPHSTPACRPRWSCPPRRWWPHRIGEHPTFGGACPLQHHHVHAPPCGGPVVSA